MKYECIVIGGGASGLMFASKLKVNSGLILEGSKSAGTKLLMSGGGRCNITHAGSIKDFINCYGESGKRIRSSLYKHNNLELIELLESNGVRTVTNEEGRVFPESMRARDVLEIFVRLARDNGFEISTESKVTGIAPTEGGYEVATAGRTFKAKTVVIATGGITYPATGSDGSMFPILRGLGLEVTKLHSVLAPIAPAQYPYSELAGISIPKARITTGTGKKNRSESEGPVLFAHKELTGPAVLNISRYAGPGSEISINYIPDFNAPLEALTAAAASSRADYSSIVAETFRLPKRFAQTVVARAANGKTTANRDGISLKRVIEILTADKFTVEAIGSNGMVTAGGVALSEISTSTMESKKFPGLYIIGEALDVDGITGGYNLQFAYSSASAAAAAAASYFAANSSSLD